jgi:hypothetical protein
LCAGADPVPLKSEEAKRKPLQITLRSTLAFSGAEVVALLAHSARFQSGEQFEKSRSTLERSSYLVMQGVLRISGRHALISTDAHYDLTSDPQSESNESAGRTDSNFRLDANLSLSLSLALSSRSPSRSLRLSFSPTRDLSS